MTSIFFSLVQEVHLILGTRSSLYVYLALICLSKMSLKGCLNLLGLFRL